MGWFEEKLDASTVVNEVILMFFVFHYPKEWYCLVVLFEYLIIGTSPFIYTQIFKSTYSKQNETRLFRWWKKSGKPVSMINFPLFTGFHTRTPLRWQSLMNLSFLESLISSGQSGASSYRFETGESVRKFPGEIFRGNSWMRVFGSGEKWHFFFDGKGVCNV